MALASRAANTAYDAEVLVVGGGPVGVFLACRLLQSGVSCLVLERDVHPRPHSRAIGVHPPSLERLEGLGLAEAFLQEGVRVGRGHLFVGERPAPLGTLEFTTCAPPYPFILTLPQARTEALLGDYLRALDPGALRRGVAVTGLEQDEAGVRVRVLQGGEQGALRGRFLVAADGKASTVRRLLGIPFRGGRYPDTYLMGDTHDATTLGTDAGLYFTRAGLVESFPLPGGVRRWVVKTPTYMRDPTPELLERLVWERVRQRAEARTNTMLSAFGVQRFLAERFVQGRVCLVGDAAHVVSPIGGQGMNLGWLGAWTLADALCSALSGEVAGLARYNRLHRRAARQATLRATFNTLMGRATPLDGLRNALSWSILHTPLRSPFARVFTMRGL